MTTARRQLHLLDASGRGVAAALVATIAGLSVASLAHALPTGLVDSRIRTSLAAAAADASARAPVRINSSTTLVGAVVSGRRLTYYLSVSRDLPDQAIDELRRTAALTIRESACTIEEKRELVKLGASLSYRFRFPSGREFFLVVDDCG